MVSRTRLMTSGAPGEQLLPASLARCDVPRRSSIWSFAGGASRRSKGPSPWPSRRCLNDRTKVCYFVGCHLSVLCWNFDAFALSYPGDPGTGCRLSKCGGFNACVRKDEFGPYRTASGGGNRIWAKSFMQKKSRPTPFGKYSRLPARCVAPAPHDGADHTRVKQRILMACSGAWHGPVKPVSLIGNID